MNNINRLDIYHGYFLLEAMEIVDTWGNRKAYTDCSSMQHLINNMNGWLAEEKFKATFPEWDYINKEDHQYLSRFEGWNTRSGKPDFKYKDFTCEVKKYASEAVLLNKIEAWKKNSTELHNANFVYILIDTTWYSLNRDTWTYRRVCQTDFPSWYRGEFKIY